MVPHSLATPLLRVLTGTGASWCARCEIYHRYAAEQPSDHWWLADVRGLQISARLALLAGPSDYFVELCLSNGSDAHARVNLRGAYLETTFGMRILPATASVEAAILDLAPRRADRVRTAETRLRFPAQQHWLFPLRGHHRQLRTVIPNAVAAGGERNDFVAQFRW